MMIETIKTIKVLVKTLSTALLSLLLFGCDSNNNTFQGYVEGDYTYMSSAVSGNLTKRLVDRGNKVEANQPLFVLDPEPETAKLNQAQSQLVEAKQQLLNLEKGARATIIENIESQLRQARAGLSLARKTFVRHQELYKARAVDKARFDDAKTKYEQSIQNVNAINANLSEAKLGARENLINAQKAAVKAAKALTGQAKWALLQKSIRSPVKAQVFDTIYEPGEFVKAGFPVVVLLAPQNIKVVFFVPEKVVSTISQGDNMIIDCDSCKNSYNAKINFISPSAEFTPPVIFSQESRDKLVYRVEAKMSLENAVKFHPGQPVDVIYDRK